MAINIQSIPNSGSDGRFLDNFKGRLSGGGVRPNLFEISLDFPKAAIPTSAAKKDLSDRMTFLVKATSLPASTITPIPVPFRGRVLQIAGDRTFDPWQITVINDEDFMIRSAFERWMNYINKHSDNSGRVDPADYQRDAFVHQLGRARTTNATQSRDDIPRLRSYKMYGVFPTNISAIPLAYDANNQIEEFTVDLQLQWWDAYTGKKLTDVR